jgi:hypothetical protein
LVEGINRFQFDLIVPPSSKISTNATSDKHNIMDGVAPTNDGRRAARPKANDAFLVLNLLPFGQW